MKFNKSIFIIILINLFLIFLLFFIYLDFSNSQDDFNKLINEDLNSFEKVLENIHNEDVLLYRTLLSEDINSFNSLEASFEINSEETNLIKNLYEFSSNNEGLSSKVDLSLKEYFKLENSRLKIIELHKLDLISSIENYDKQLRILLDDYEIEVEKNIINFNENLMFIKIKRDTFQDQIKFKLFIQLFILILFYMMTISFYIFKISNSSIINNKNKFFDVNENNINSFNDINFLDIESKKLIIFLKKEISNGFYPTIKDVKKELKLTHPTILSRLNLLEKNNIIGIKKNGRNKNIYLK